MNRFPTRSAGLLILFLAVMVSGAGVWAQKFLDNYKMPMPEVPAMAEADFVAATDLYDEKPFDDKGLAFQIRVPKGWQKQSDVSLSDAAIGNKILGVLVRFYGPPKLDLRSRITIEAQKLEYQLTAEQWFIQYMLANAFTLQGMRVIDDKRIEALYVYVEKDTTYVVRTVAQINGKRVLMAQYYLPVDLWEEEKQIQARSVASFAIKNPLEEDIEKMEKYHFLDIAQFSYPASWQLQVDSLKSIDRLKAQMLSVASEETVKKKRYKLLNGKMEINMISFHVIDTLAGEIKDFRKQITQSGIALDKLIETKNDFVFSKGMQASPVEVYKAIDTENNNVAYEIWFMVLEAGEYYYFVTLLTPSRDEDYFTWSRNTQTFRIMVKSLTPQESTLISD